LNPNAKPLASPDLALLIYGLIKELSGAPNGGKKMLRVGMARVESALAKDRKGLVVLAGLFFLRIFFFNTNIFFAIA
jgi:hypothetical protein